MSDYPTARRSVVKISKLGSFVLICALGIVVQRSASLSRLRWDLEPPEGWDAYLRRTTHHGEGPCSRYPDLACETRERFKRPDECFAAVRAFETAMDAAKLGDLLCRDFVLRPRCRRASELFREWNNVAEEAHHSEPLGSEYCHAVASRAGTVDAFLLRCLSRWLSQCQDPLSYLTLPRPAGVELTAEERERLRAVWSHDALGLWNYNAWADSD